MTKARERQQINTETVTEAILAIVGRKEAHGRKAVTTSTEVAEYLGHVTVSSDTREAVLYCADAAGFRVRCGGNLERQARVRNAKLCESEKVTGERCRERADEVVEWMPRALRGAHRAAGNWGRHPRNGSIHIHVCEGCAIDIVDGDPDGYARILEDEASHR